MLEVIAGRGDGKSGDVQGEWKTLRRFILPSVKHEVEAVGGA